MDSAWIPRGWVRGGWSLFWGLHSCGVGTWSTASAMDLDLDPRDIRKNLQRLVRARAGADGCRVLGVSSLSDSASIRNAYRVLCAFCSDDDALLTMLAAAQAAALSSVDDENGVACTTEYKPYVSLTQYWFWTVLTSPSGTRLTWPVPLPLHGHAGDGDGAQHNARGRTWRG